MRPPMVIATAAALAIAVMAAAPVCRAQSQIETESSRQITAQPVGPPPPSPPPAQPAAPTAAPIGGYRIAGTVLSATDGHTLQRATVRIYPSGRPAAVQTTTSDSSGQFSFSGVAAGTFVLEGSATGFVTSSYEQHGTFNTGIVTGAGVDTESLVLALQPQSIIALTLTDESGEPIERASVRLFRQSADTAAEPGTFDARPIAGQAGTTDDLGRFHSAPLPPGTYLLAVQATPWYAVHPMHPDGEPTGPIGFVDSIQPGLDVAYPITYYPGATDSSRAAGINLRGGDTVELSMQLRAEPAFTLTLPAPANVTQEGPRNRNVPQQQPTFTQVSTSIFGEPQAMPVQQYQTGDHMIVTGLPPGDYTLHQMRGGSIDSGGTPVRITDHSISADPGNQSSSAHVTAELRAVDGTRVSRPTQLLLLRNREVVRRVIVDLRGAASFDIEPGDYTLSVQGGSRSLQLRRVFEHDQPVADNRVHLAAGAQASYVVSVVPGDHTVRGVIQQDGKPAAGVFVLLIPTSDLAAPETFYRDQSDLDGSFQIRGIAAGDYTLFAVQHGWELDWHKKPTYDRYLPHATPIHIADDAASVQKLPDPIAAQAR
jgi:hypothetical protein